MKPHKIVSIVAFILIVVGITFVIWGFQPIEDNFEVEIPAGGEYYYFIQISNYYNGHLSGNYEVVSGGTIDIYILDSNQYNEYSYDLLPSSNMYHSTGASGSFSVDLPTTSAHYITMDHGSGYDSITQTVEITYKVTGLYLFFLIIGIVVLAIGIAVTILGLRMKKKDAAPTAEESKAIDVTTFEEKPGNS